MTLMTYTNLIATKGTAGSIANWVNYTKLEPVLPTILEEAQTLIYSLLRVREMQATLTFKLAASLTWYDLPTRFRDPIGDMRCVNQNYEVIHRIPSTVRKGRSFTTSGGTLGTNPFTTVNASSLVTVALPAHGFTQGSVFAPVGASAVGGLTLDGAYEIVSTSTNTFVIESGTAASSGATGGGVGITYDCSVLAQGQPEMWSIWDNRLQFDQPTNAQLLLQLQFYQSLPLLSATNLTNFLTDRHPHALRVACTAQAADFMKDTEEYNKAMQRLGAYVEKAQIEDDLQHRGADLETWNPGSGR